MLEVKPFSFRDRRYLELLDRGGMPDPEQEMEAAEVMAAVRAGGRKAIEETFRENNSPGRALLISPEELSEARDQVSERFLTALSLARVNIRKFHEYQRRHGYVHDDGDGVRLSRRVRPLSRVGICCGVSHTALLMHAVPAQVAGVGEIAVAASPRPDGSVDPRLLATAKVLGIDEIYRMGGAHAVAAMGYGVDPVKRVDKIVGPGDGLTAAAKRLIRGKVGVDPGLGVAELAVVADDSANARFIAADLLGQAECENGHGALVLFTTDRLLAEAVRIELDRLLDAQGNDPRLHAALDHAGALYVCQSLDQAIDAVNALAPARLSLMTRDDEEYLSDVLNAGLVLVGPWSVEAAGDFFAGVNPFLPLAGAVRHASGLGVDDFVRQMTVLEYTPERLLLTGRHLTTMAEEDGGQAHSAALHERLELLKLTVE